MKSHLNLTFKKHEYNKSDNILEIDVYNNVKTTEDTNKIKDLFIKNKTKIIKLNFKDSYIFTSYLIGSLIKLKYVDKRNFKLVINNKDLQDLLTRLNLKEILNCIYI